MIPGADIAQENLAGVDGYAGRKLAARKGLIEPPDGFGKIDEVLSYEQRIAIVRGYASTAGFAQSQVNKPAKAG